MLFLFLLNVLGFYGIFLGLQFKFKQDANRELDEDRYAGMDVVTFKLPLAVPYYSDNQDYERVSGEFEHEGEVYRLLKQKYSGGMLFIVCVKDNEAKKISQALTDYVKTFTDKPLNAKQQSAKSVPSFCKDYMTIGISLQSLTSGWKKQVTHGTATNNYHALVAFGIKYPPKQVSF